MSGPVLTHELMGVLALWILWVNSLLIAAVALKRAAALSRRRRALVPAVAGPGVEGLFQAKVDSDGPLAEVIVEQVGRALGDASKDPAAPAGKRAIAFADRAYATAVHGGAVRAPSGALLGVAGGSGEAWVSLDDLRGAAACPSPGSFASGLAEASRAKGWTRTVRALISRGDEVWVYGKVSSEGVIGPGREGLLVSKVDPRAWLSRSAALSASFAAASILGAAICTAVALQPPVFGPVSTFGGALSLAFFLLIQPAGTAVRDLVREPSRSILRGEWRDPSGGTATNAGEMERGRT